jgi:hypothetical protein
MGRSHLEDQGIDDRIIIKWTFKKCHERYMDWIALAQDGDRWRELVTAVVDHRVP